MRVLRFELSGKTAFFKNPEVNSYFYFTFGQIHKPALLGIFGAVMGYQGYGAEYEDFPEYYKILKDIRVSIVPKSPYNNGYFAKKIQSFNNSVGYASQEQGGNLIVKEQWIENPAWDIYFVVENELTKELAERILQNRCVYIPYLGKNDHPAVLKKASFLELEEASAIEERIHSLIPSYMAQYNWEEAWFKYEEYLPVSLKESTNHYELQKFYYTDAVVEEIDGNVLKDGERFIVFY
ncbi:MAG: type I-B CRISPR-associated protein Cas5b [Lachnospiraceae bacterium]|nr:type I-B CRISPR-associated protein Cas5b [Lachnospiraceae bacterium]